MCVPYDGLCDGWSHPFAQTLHVGDIIVIQGVDPKTLSIKYPNSDIIVYQNPDDPEATPIVHRIVSSYTVNGTLYFQTKGDGNGFQRYPEVPTKEEYDSNTLWHTGQGVPADYVIGKVVMRVPWFGHITLFLRGNPWGLPLIVALIIILLVIEFVLPILKSKKTQSEQSSEGGEVRQFTLISG
jgi:hypothetical protein